MIKICKILKKVIDIQMMIFIETDAEKGAFY